ncbi:hypothetical protein DBR42_02790 [Pelomonas sp. HMWF004]|nr:hypothetical protein DBR42_02790 [Pelomonas sp. HMWF004]
MKLKMKTIPANLIALATVLGLSAGPTRAAGEADFWRWFKQNEVMLFDFEQDQERIFDKLGAQLQRVNPGGLAFEFGPKQNGRREFVISGDGLRKNIPAVEHLAAAAPDLPRWKIVKFRPRREPFDIGYHGIMVKASTVSAWLHPNGDRVDVTFLMPGYTAEKHQPYLGIAFLVLDQALGEYDVMTRVGVVDVQAPNVSQPAVKLEQLPMAFDAWFAKR